MQLLIAGLAYDINADAVKALLLPTQISKFLFSSSSEVRIKSKWKAICQTNALLVEIPMEKIPTKPYNLENPTKNFERVLAASKAVKNRGKARKQREKLLLHSSVEVVETGARPHSDLLDSFIVIKL